MSGSIILGYVLVTIGIITGISGGIIHPIHFMNSEFMSFLVSGFILIVIGLALIKTVPQGVLLTTLWLTVILTILYLYGFPIPMWVFIAGVIVTIGIGLWVTTMII